MFCFFFKPGTAAAAAAAKSLQSCPTLCDPIDGSPPGSPIPGILQARTLDWVAISFSNAWKWKVKGKLLSLVWLLATPWTAAHQASPSLGFSRQEWGAISPTGNDTNWAPIYICLRQGGCACGQQPTDPPGLDTPTPTLQKQALTVHLLCRWSWPTPGISPTPGNSKQEGGECGELPRGSSFLSQHCCFAGTQTAKWKNPQLHIRWFSPWGKIQGYHSLWRPLLRPQVN